jgi:hypothetical protein
LSEAYPFAVDASVQRPESAFGDFAFTDPTNIRLHVSTFRNAKGTGVAYKLPANRAA